MEINDFDKYVKENMSKMEVVPSSSVKKALAFKMFFNNLLLFHKMKLVIALLSISGGVIVGVNYLNDNEQVAQQEQSEINSNELLVQQESVVVYDVDVKNEQIDSDEEFVSNKKINEGVLANEKIVNNDVAALKESESKKVNSNAVVKDENYTNVVEQNISTAKSNTESLAFNEESNTTTEKQFDVNAVTNNANTANEERSKESNTTDSSNDNFEKNPTIAATLIENSTQLEDVNILERAETIKGGIETSVNYGNLPAKIELAAPVNDYANNPKKRGLTLDAYATVINQVDIDNKLDDDLEKYYWDFYKEYAYVSSGMNGGINVNYNWNNFKIGSGLNFNTVRDYKSTYKYFFLSDLMSSFNIPDISSAVVFEEDTTFVFYVDPNNEKLKKQVEDEYNSYSYLNIPLTVGYELDFKYGSLELNGGVQYGYLLHTKGVEVKYGDVINDPVQVYFYSDRYMDLLSRKSENLNKHQFSLLGNATLRIRLTPSFDVYSSFQYSQSQNGIYSRDYFLQKNYKNYGVKFGVTYYLNKRLKLKNNTVPGF